MRRAGCKGPEPWEVRRQPRAKAGRRGGAAPERGRQYHPAIKHTAGAGAGDVLSCVYQLLMFKCILANAPPEWSTDPAGRGVCHRLHVREGRTAEELMN